MHQRAIHFAVFFIAVGGLIFFATQTYILSGETNASESESDVNESVEIDTSVRFDDIEVSDNDTFGILMERAGVSSNDSASIYASALPMYDLARIRVGRVLRLGYDIQNDNLTSLMYPIDSESELLVKKDDSGAWQAELVNIDYEVEVVTVGGTIESSMYEAALSLGIDERAVIELANVFQWSVDFAMDVRTGDQFVFTYEKRYRNGEYVMPGKILAGKFVNSGTSFYAFAFEDGEGNVAYYDENGNSVQKMFLKAPVEFKYISSGFTTGLRYVQAFNTSTGHRAIDYAATAGTPIRSVGDGVVAQAGWNGPYGNFVSVRHNGTYTTNYAHMSRMVVKVGQRVSQGDVIGYVGSTGFSTGPHLHYEMVKNGTKINPLLEVLPPGEALAGETIEEFKALVNERRVDLDN